MLVSTERGVVGLIRKVADQDEGAAQMLVRLSAYDAMCDLADALQPQYERELEAFVAKRSEDGRRALVRSFIERRSRGEDVQDVIKAASMMTMVEISKEVVDADPNRPGALGRDTSTGRFARLGSALDRGLSSTQAKEGLNAADGSRGGYDRLSSLGSVVTASGQPAVGGAIAAAAAIGPQAERVLGPGIQRAAYRFRGTERRPSNDLLNARADYGEQLMARNPNLRGDAKRLQVQGDAAAAYLMSRLPRQEDAEISMASGRVPPSQGVIISAEGDIISESVGMNGDHYVPFDLKNLAELEGGQYVRTRAAGGPTREDLYTALMSGARQVQVVSHSGVFTLELDPDLRGSRRYSDKARQMAGRYQSMLETIESEKVAAVPLDERTMSQLRTRALRMSGDDLGKAKEKLPELVREEMGRQAFERDREAEEAEVQEAIQHRVRAEERKAGEPFTAGRRAAIARDVEGEVREQLRSETPRSLRLDGEGYSRALNALQGEFPQFIREVRHEPLREFAQTTGQNRLADRFTNRGGRDKGFVASGSNLASVSRGEDRARTTQERAQSESQRARAAERAQGSSTPREGGTDRGSTPRTADVAQDTGSKDNGGVPRFTSPKIKPSPSPQKMIDTPEGAALMESASEDLDLLRSFEPDLSKLHENNRSENSTGLDYLMWAIKDKGRGRPADTAHWLLTKATDEQREYAAQQLEAINDQAVDISGWQGNALAEIEVATDNFASLLRTMNGTKPATEQALMAPLGNKGQALGFQQLDDLGVRLQNFKEWRDVAENTNPLFKTVLRQLEGGNSKSLLNQAAAERNRLVKHLEDPEDEMFALPAGMSERAARDKVAEYDETLPLMHLAHSYLDRRMKIQTLQERFGLGGGGTEGEQAPPFEPVSARWSGSPSRSSVRLPRRSSVRKSTVPSPLEAALAAAWAVAAPR